MGYMIEIEEKKMDKLSEHLEESLRHMGKAMSCIDTMMGGGYGEREGMNYRDDESYSRYGKHIGMRGGSMGYRESEDWDDDEMNERRGRRRRSNGRYY